MKRIATFAAALALTGCVSCPMPAPAPPTAQTARNDALLSSSYALSGEIDSMLVQGTIKPAVAIKLNDKLRKAQTELRAGHSYAAQALVEAVKKELP